MAQFDAIVIGGGLVGAAIGYGLARAGLESRSSTKATSPSVPRVAISAWSGSSQRASAHPLPALDPALRRGMAGFGSRLGERTGISVRLEQPGGLQLCLGEEELEKRRAMMEQMRREAGNFGFEYRMLDRNELAGILPGLGPSVAGASWTPYDGHANSLNLLHALHKGFSERGGTYLPNRTVIEAHAAPYDFRLDLPARRSSRPRSCSPQGSATPKLAPLFGLSAPVRPQRGQILVTERTNRIWPLPLGSLRQTQEGTIMLGSSEEDVGFDTGQNPEVMRNIARRAVLSLPVDRRVADRARLGGIARHAA